MGLHAEDGEIIAEALARWSGPPRPAAHCATRPPVSETAAVAAALELAAATGVHLHIYHASLPRTFELVAGARAGGSRRPPRPAPITCCSARTTWTGSGRSGR